ncbi:peptidase [Paenibacillus sp. E194]|nr:peptidase [Paenibacillus sp. E194]
MRLSDVKGAYDAMYSLGSNCYTAQRLERYGLRPYSGVVDWMYSNWTPGVSLLLRNRFAKFMYPDHLVVESIIFKRHNYCILDRVYGVQSVHDFLYAERRRGIALRYPKFIETIQRRIHRFLDKAEHSERIFYFRLNASYDEAAELEAALASLVKHQFSLLVVNPGNEHRIIDKEWPLANTCGLELPIGWDAACDQVWNEVFAGIHYQVGIRN